MTAILFVGLPEMEAIALIGLLGIASVAAWTSATLWQRQRAIERDVTLLYEHLRALEPGSPVVETWDDVRLPSLSTFAESVQPASWDPSSAVPPGGTVSAHSAEVAEVADQLLQSSPEALRRMLAGSLNLSQPAIFTSTEEDGHDGYARGPWRPADLER